MSKQDEIKKLETKIMSMLEKGLDAETIYKRLQELEFAHVRVAGDLVAMKSVFQTKKGDE